MSTDSALKSGQRDRDYETLLDAIPDLMLRLNRDGICLDFRLARDFRLRSREIDWRGKRLSDIIPPELAQQRMHHVERAIATNEIQIYEQQIEVDGQLQYEEVRVIRSNDREALVIIRDISERKAQEAALKQSEAQLRQRSIELEATLQELRRTQAQLIHSEKMSSLGQLVAGIAHEINNPISFIHGNINHAHDYVCDLTTLINLYQKHYSPPVQEIQAYAEKIELDFIRDDLFDLFASMQTGTERIRQIVLSLRTFSRLDEAEIKAIDLHESLESTLTILQNRLHQPDHCIEVIKHYGRISQVECYASEINQVFLHLLNNAVDALETQPLPTIVIHTEQLNSAWIRIRIIDNGSGISEAVQTRIFDPFFTTKSIGKGSGMGLSVSHQIVTEQHGGVLTCVSAPNQGSEFRIDLPICQTCGQVGKPPESIDGSRDSGDRRSLLQ